MVPASLALLIVGLVAGLLLGRGIGSGVEAIDDPVDVGFARDMMTHHAQAVEMSSIVYGRAADPKLDFLAYDILTTQHGQIGIMSGWLNLWGQPQGSSEPVMAWMGDQHAGSMPGMASDEEIAELATLPVQQMEEQYLRLMIDHHRGALPMAQYAAENASSPHLASLAETMVTGQASEIDLMQSMLAARGAAPEPEPGAAGDHGGGTDHDASRTTEPSPAVGEHDGH